MESKNMQSSSGPNMAGTHAAKPKRPYTSRRNLAFLIITFCIVCIAGALMSLGFIIALKVRPQATIEQQRQVIASEGEVIADIAQQVSPSVVSIVTEQQRVVNSYYGDKAITGQAAGTGLIVDTSGLILTNKHVVPEGTSSVKIVMSDGTVYSDVTIVGRDPLNDIAVLQVKDPKNFKSAVLGDSDIVRTGQKVIAIGNALGQFQNTVTSGIISGVGRPVEAGSEDGSGSEQLTNLFQTDAAINSGNSGGPLLNYDGEVIGINTAIAADAQNIGFSIPINEAKGAVTSVQKTGKLTRPLLGVKFMMITPELVGEKGLNVSKGAYISTDSGSVVVAGPADKAGVRPGDIITKINGLALDQRRPLDSVISRYAPGDTVILTVVRDGKDVTLKATLAEAAQTN
ncbi:trypsin-like peptidase domain-containing protein [Candidatus Saccharibacteria bacterium]|nr:trypsin-like peptidase domain-containing protein [Candidatus Saccharibacteria bacterium]